MSRRDGHIELDRPVDAIVVGQRHRRDLGDHDQLVASIRELGILQPITISPDGTLICGARRLEAARRLGLRHINVWVRSGISTRLRQLLAEQHDHTTRKPFTPTEAAGLYRELKTLIAEDAARRQHASRFGAPTDVSARHAGPADSAGPQEHSRSQAARLVTGRQSYTLLEQVSELQRIAADPDAADRLRAAAAEALAGIDADGKVHRHYQRFKDTQGIETADRHATLAALASEALARVHDGRRSRRRTAPAIESRPPRRYGVRAFVLTWGELSGWDSHYDPAEIGKALNEQNWAAFEATVAATAAFADTARSSRAARDA